MAVEIEIKRGATFEYNALCVDELEDPVDMSTWTFASDLKLSSSREKLVSFAIDSTDAATGTLVLSATPAQTLNLPPSMELDFDIKFTTAGGDVYYSEDINLNTSKHITH